MNEEQRKKRYQRIEYMRHDESVALYGRGILVDLKPGQYLVRVEAAAAKGPGNWFHGPFQNFAEAQRYARYLADLGESGIRRENALPRVWQGGGAGNAIDVIRIYRVHHESPAISSVVAPQREAGTVMVRPAHRAAMKTGNIMASAEYAGQGQQLCIPVWQVAKNEGLDLVGRVPGAEIRVSKP